MMCGERRLLHILYIIRNTLYMYKSVQLQVYDIDDHFLMLVTADDQYQSN